mmetsp:Transcript_9732/g.22225  ORF Transcript_9732/g.22225 Transcript_9732/m.22225 type:complete len:226 (-) Transcript_9732:405-1082(-)
MFGSSLSPCKKSCGKSTSRPRTRPLVKRRPLCPRPLPPTASPPGIGAGTDGADSGAATEPPSQPLLLRPPSRPSPGPSLSASALALPRPPVRPSLVLDAGSWVRPMHAFASASVAHSFQGVSSKASSRAAVFAAAVFLIMAQASGAAGSTTSSSHQNTWPPVGFLDARPEPILVPSTAPSDLADSDNTAVVDAESAAAAGLSSVTPPTPPHWYPSLCALSANLSA